MTMRAIKSFIKKQDGAAGVEFAVVAALYFVVFFAIIDFGRLWFAYNTAEKATQVGARFAIVRDPVYPPLEDFDAIDAGIVPGNGERLPVNLLGVVTCTSAGCTCQETLGGNCSVLPSSNVNNVEFRNLVRRMQWMMPQIQEENVSVIYRHVGLGFSGNPFGPDYSPTVTVQLNGLTFNFVTPALLGLGSINLPAYATTLTGEDFKSS